MICKNCGYDFEGNYCNNCGQKAKTVRLDWHYLSDEAKYTFLHFNNGLMYSCKQLVTRPGHTVREYVEGQRVKHYKPFLLLFVLAGIYGFCTHYIDFEHMAFSQESHEMDAREQYLQSVLIVFMKWITTHYSLIEILTLPIASLCSWIAFKSWGYNYVEHIVINAFSASLRILVSLVIFPFNYALLNTPFSMVTGMLGILGTFGASVWCYVQFFKDRNLGDFILRYLLLMFLMGMVYIVISVIAVVFVLLDMKEKGVLFQ